MALWRSFAKEAVFEGTDGKGKLFPIKFFTGFIYSHYYNNQ